MHDTCTLECNAADGWTGKEVVFKCGSDGGWHGNRIPKCTKAVVLKPVFINDPYVVLKGHGSATATRSVFSTFRSDGDTDSNSGGSNEQTNQTTPRTCFDIAAEERWRPLPVHDEYAQQPSPQDMQGNAYGERLLHVNVTFKDSAMTQACNRMMEETYSGGLKMDVDNTVLTLFIRRFASVPELQRPNVSLTAAGGRQEGASIATCGASSLMCMNAASQRKALLRNASVSVASVSSRCC